MRRLPPSLRLRAEEVERNSLGNVVPFLMSGMTDGCGLCQHWKQDSDDVRWGLCEKITITEDKRTYKAKYANKKGNLRTSYSFYCCNYALSIRSRIQEKK